MVVQICAFIPSVPSSPRCRIPSPGHSGIRREGDEESRDERKSRWVVLRYAASLPS